LKVPFSYNCRARYVKVVATNFGKIPDWHPGKGEPAWLFVDEITAR
jgi:hexosaminidase